MMTRIIGKFTGQIVPDRIYIVQIWRHGFFGTKWTSVKGFESYDDAKQFERTLK